MFNKIKAIKDLRTQAKQVQNTLEDIVAEGEAAWGKVKVKMNGNQKVLDISIADELMADKAKLVESLKEAYADATKKLQKEMAGKMKDMEGLKDMMKNLGM
jgi:DNA-binding protein YbaB